jgi:single-strand DNA-binding protein
MQMLGGRQGMGGDAGGGMGMDEGGYDAPPSRPAPRQAPPAPATRPQAQRPAPNFSDMDDDIPF